LNITIYVHSKSSKKRKHSYTCIIGLESKNKRERHAQKVSFILTDTVHTTTMQASRIVVATLSTTVRYRNFEMNATITITIIIA